MPHNAAAHKPASSSPSPSALSGLSSESSAPGRHVSLSDESQAEEQKVDRPLVEWVWRYFSGAHAPTQDMHRKPSQPRPTSSVPATAVSFESSGDSMSMGTRPTDDENLRRDDNSSLACESASVDRKTQATLRPLLSSSPVHVTGLPPLYFQHAGV